MAMVTCDMKGQQTETSTNRLGNQQYAKIQ